ncbi:uncharacterized protein [Penaeus vannamei]|uniref:uncharacterized protein isoform X1 n=2 Tax=Penaeus vannamei TaxID=6689 RepID=UPI000F689FB2|nr:uncharacterized protein LOC113820370 isoform X1 [Penaeus vannamei]
MSSLVSSARYAGTQDIYEDSLTMYFHGDHKGPEYLVVRDIDFLREVFEDVASSFVITGSSSWTVHEHPDMTGKSACMEPTQQGNWFYGIFDVADLHGFGNDMVSSVSKGCNSENIFKYVPKYP